MLLTQLRLQNIRSYLEETLDFPGGTTLLSGDIGSGKSTILLAIEFALFGISRPDLTGEALLRKGCTQGSVELSFILEDKKLTIRRNLKKDNEGVKQTSGYLIINERKKELTPVELKAEIVNLLGYPEETISKNKNYLFRFTIYTPQEEMKYILQEDPEIRQEVLRKIFNLDKYQKVRENLQFYLKQMRTKLAVLEAKTESLETVKQQGEEIAKEKERINRSWEETLPQLKLLEQQLTQQKEALEQLEEKQRQFLQKRQQAATLSALLEEKKAQQSQLEKSWKQIQEQVLKVQASLPSLNWEELKAKLDQYREQKNALLTQKARLQEKLWQLMQQIKETQQQISELEKHTLAIEEKKNLSEQLHLETKELAGVKTEKAAAEEKIFKLNEEITRQQTLLKKAQELQEKIQQLHHCPTCLQEVPEEHKEKILQQEQQQIDAGEKKLEECRQEKKEEVLRKESLEKKTDALQNKENLLHRLQTELEVLQEKKKDLAHRQEQLRQWIQEHNHLAPQLESLEKGEQISQIEQNLSILQEQQELFRQKKHWEERQQELSFQLELILQQLGQLELKKEQLQLELDSLEDHSAKISEQRQIATELLNRERESSILLAKLQTQKEYLEKQESQILQNLKILETEKNRLLRLRELYFWLEEHLLQLTHTLEKQMMVAIHRLFNQLFQEWFSILIDDENISSRLDDSFTPIIEQNGYEISFSNLSGGERTSAALAYRLALNRVINEVIPEVKTKELLILDEPTDGFSSEQLDKVRAVLEKLKLGQILIVSHESKIETFVEKVVRIAKEGNVSRIG